MTPFRWQNGNPYLRENTINTAVRSLSRLQPIETGACLTFCHFDKDHSIGTSIKSTVACFNKAFIGDNKIKKITFKGKKLKTVNKNAFSKKAKKNIKSKKTKLKGNKKAIKLFKKKLKIK